MISFSLLFQLAIFFWASVFLIDLFRSYKKRNISFHFALVFGGAAILGVVFVFLPRASDAIFSLIGISSGANGSFFIAIVILIILAKRQHKVIRELKANQTKIVRGLAITNNSHKE